NIGMQLPFPQKNTDILAKPARKRRVRKNKAPGFIGAEKPDRCVIREINQLFPLLADRAVHFTLMRDIVDAPVHIPGPPGNRLRRNDEPAFTVLVNRFELNRIMQSTLRLLRQISEMAKRFGVVTEELRQRLDPRLTDI